MDSRGDFNMIRTIEEKRGGIRRENQYMGEFDEMITEQRLVDIPTINGIHTWNNRRGGKNQIASRLDRFLLEEQVMNQDVYVEAKIVPAMGSNHWSIRLEIDIKKNSHKKPFRFEDFWLMNSEFLSKIEEWWNQSTQKGKGKMHTFQLKLKELKRKINMEQGRVWKHNEGKTKARKINGRDSTTNHRRRKK